MEKRLAKEGIKTHKERVDEYNKYLASLSEHHDMYVLSRGCAGLRVLMQPTGRGLDPDNICCTGVEAGNHLDMFLVYDVTRLYSLLPVKRRCRYSIPPFLRSKRARS